VNLSIILQANEDVKKDIVLVVSARVLMGLYMYLSALQTTHQKLL